MISARKRAGPFAGFLLSLFFSAILVLIATADLFLASRLPEGRPLPFTIRLPEVTRLADGPGGEITVARQRPMHPRGSSLTADELQRVHALERHRRPPGHLHLAALSLSFLLVLLLFTTHLRVISPQTALVRTQLVLLGGLLLLAAGSKFYLVATPFSIMWLPLTAWVIPIAIHRGPRAAAATSVAGSLILGLLFPGDLTLAAVLLAQGLAAAVSAGRRDRRLPHLRGTIAATLAGGFTFAALDLLFRQAVPDLRLLLPAASLRGILSADLAGAAGGALLGGILALPLSPLAGRWLGIVSRFRLMALANLEHPLLRQLATEAPGTWAHSMAMANMAEMAANAIGANPLLVRVGALYHDIGKSEQPDYFVENQRGANPHDALEPSVSADAIFAHVLEGVRLARRHKLPPAVVEFIYTHHGNGVLEYFWHKNQKLGNPLGLTAEEFRYPGCPPQSPETAILSICDAVEAASRTISEPDLEKVRQLVRQIVFTKLEQGMLGAAGLIVPDLERIVLSIIDTLKSSFHSRLRYPWQGEEMRPAPSTGSRPDLPVAPEPAKRAAGPVPLVPAGSRTPAPPPASLSREPAWVTSPEVQDPQGVLELRPKSKS